MTEVKEYKITIFCAPQSVYAESPAAIVNRFMYVLAIANWTHVPITVTARDYKKGEVIGESKPRMRDRFNPLYYIRKELQKMSDTFTQATDRIEKKIAEVNANVEALKTTVANEAAQFATVVEELRGMSTNENLTAAQSGRLGALADELDTSAQNIKAATEGVKGIVPDHGLGVDPPAAALKIQPPTQDIVAGTAFEIKVLALDAHGNPAKGYGGTLHFASSPSNTGDVLPADHVYGTDDHLAVLFAAPGTYVLSVIAVGESVTPDQLSIRVS